VLPILTLPNQRTRIPSGSKRIGSGITFSWGHGFIQIAANLDVSARTRELVQDGVDIVASSVMAHWNKTFEDGFRIACVPYVLPAATPPDPNRTHIFIGDKNSTPYVIRPTPVTPYYSYMSLAPADLNSWLPAHEFGHLLGLGDRYHESFSSAARDTCNFVLNGFCGGQRHTVPQQGWQQNIMANAWGVLERRNVDELLALHATVTTMPGGPLLLGGGT